MAKYIPDAVQSERTVRYGPWPKGMNNRQPDYALPDGTLRNAVNADIDNAGLIRRRAGYEKVYGNTDLRGGYSCPLGAYFIQGTKLCKLNDDNTATPLFDGVFGPTPTYAYFNDTVYFSDGLITKKITAAGGADWGIPVPAAPLLYTVNGSLPAGTYLVAITRVDADGRESGASEIMSLELTDPLGVGAVAGITVTGLPTSLGIRVYASTTNGATLFLAAELAAGTATYTLTTSSGTGAPLATEQIVPPPPGQIIREHSGRICIASDQVLWMTEPFAPDWVSLDRGFIMQAAYISVMEPVSSGVWLVSDKTYFLRGAGPEEFKVESKLPHGAVYGSGAAIPYTNDVLWYSDRGIILGAEDGQVKNLQEQEVAPHSGTSAATLVREQDGLRQAVVSVQDAELSPLAASTFIQMEVVRKAGGHQP